MRRRRKAPRASKSQPRTVSRAQRPGLVLRSQPRAPPRLRRRRRRRPLLPGPARRSEALRPPRRIGRLLGTGPLFLLAQIALTWLGSSFVLVEAPRCTRPNVFHRGGVSGRSVSGSLEYPMLLVRSFNHMHDGSLLLLQNLSGIKPVYPGPKVNT